MKCRLAVHGLRNDFVRQAWEKGLPRVHYPQIITNYTQCTKDNDATLMKKPSNCHVFQIHRLTLFEADASTYPQPIMFTAKS
jgi:hypothetical protein